MLFFSPVGQKLIPFSFRASAVATATIAGAIFSLIGRLGFGLPNRQSIETSLDLGTVFTWSPIGGGSCVQCFRYRFRHGRGGSYMAPGDIPSGWTDTAPGIPAAERR